jgi:hypothetical protein
MHQVYLTITFVGIIVLTFTLLVALETVIG